MTELFARAVVWARVPIVVAWVAAAIVMAVALPTLEEAQTGALGQLVPAGSRALEAERLSAELFAFPLAAARSRWSATPAASSRSGSG